MSKSTDHHKSQIKKRLENLPRKYYDANSITREVLTSEIMNCEKHGFIACTSHLAIGEAIYNTADKKGLEAGERLFKLIIELKESNKLEITHCDFNRNDMDLITKTELKTSDAIHIATAINHPNCQSLITTDRDISGIPQEKLCQLFESLGKPKFKIEKREISE